MNYRRLLATTFSLLVLSGLSRAEDGFRPLFPAAGVPPGWRVTHWANIKAPPPEGAAWLVKDGVLHGSEPRGTWLVSEKEYGDFELQFEFRLGERGNSGVGLRFPLEGDPAFDGLELQMVDPRYYGEEFVDAGQLAGGLYPSLPPAEQHFRLTDWNKYEIVCRGTKIIVRLNGHTI